MNKPLKGYSGPRKKVEVFDSQKVSNQVRTERILRV